MPLAAPPRSAPSKSAAPEGETPGIVSSRSAPNCRTGSAEADVPQPSKSTASWPRAPPKKNGLHAPLLEEEVRQTEAAQDAKEEAAGRLPFSRWRCIYDPELALDKDRSEPFGVLEINIHRARGLTQTDRFDTMDPYVRLFLNGTEVARTTCKPMTCHPWWDETFLIEVFHPLSILTLEVWDSDGGTNLGDLDIFGLDDDFVGGIDVDLGEQLLNQTTSGWFHIEDEDDWRDTYLARVKAREERLAAERAADEESRPSGEQTPISLSFAMTLEADPHHEFYGMCLPLPDRGHGCPPLNLQLCLQKLFNLLEQIQPVVNFANFLSEELLKRSTTVMFFIIVVTWQPEWLFSAIVAVLLILLLVAYQKRQYFLEKDKKSDEQRKSEESLASNMSMVQKLLSTDVELMANLRMFHGNLDRVKEITDHVEEVAKIQAVWPAMFVGLTLLSLMLLVTPAWLQERMIQMGIAVGVIPVLFPTTIFGHIAQGCMEYYGKQGKRTGLENQSNHGVIVEHTPADDICRHNWNAETFSQPTWCERCNNFLWGVVKQGMKCQECSLVMCKACATAKSGDAHAWVNARSSIRSVGNKSVASAPL